MPFQSELNELHVMVCGSLINQQKQTLDQHQNKQKNLPLHVQSIKDG